MRSHVLLSLALLLPVGATTLATAADVRSCVDPICRVGTTKQLFIDDHIIDRMVGLMRVLNQPRRHPENPLLVPEHPWEGRILETPTVLWDDQKKLFHMYYWALHSEKIFNCYARSKDAVHWEKPMLGLYEGPDGTKNNNIVLRGEGNCARMRYVALNPYSDDPGKDAKVLRDVDSLRLRPAWNRSKLASLVGRVVRVKITLTRGKLYALQVKP